MSTIFTALGATLTRTSLPRSRSPTSVIVYVWVVAVEGQRRGARHGRS